MRKLKLFLLAILASCGLGATAQSYEFTFTGSSLPEGWKGSGAGSSEYSDESGKVLKLSGNGTLTYTFEAPVDLQSIDFAFAFKTKDEAHAKIVVYDASDSELGSAQLNNTAASGVKEEANVPLAYDGVKRFELTNEASCNFMISYVKFNVHDCEAPATALKLEANKTSEIYAGDEITFTLSGGNEAEKKLEGKNGEEIKDNKWTAVKGEHTFVLSQDAKDGICGGSVELKLTVGSKEPVTQAFISGKTTAVVGEEASLTCTAGNATAFQWYKNAAKIDGATEATYTFTPDAAGELTFECEASNAYTTTPVKSPVFKVLVTEAPILCGELIKATTRQVVTGEVGGSVITSLSKGDAQKLNKNKHFGITLKEGAFAEGDVFVMNITVAPDDARTMGTMKLYADKEGKELLFEADSADVGVVGENKWKLSAAVAGKSSLFVVRGGGADWNPTFSYVAVTRKCGNESSDASLKSLTVNGQAVEAKENVYAYEAPADYAEVDVKVVYELNDAKATADPAGGSFDVIVPEAGAEPITKKLTVTAEDGTKAEYIISVTRAAKPEDPKSTDATIKELKINDVAIEAKEDIYAYEVAADAELAEVEVVFVLAEKATADKESPFKVTVPEAGAAAAEETINVTAEDGVTKKAYKVQVSKAKEQQGLDDVSSDVTSQKVIRDGQLFILKNGVLFNAQGTIVK